MSVESVLRLRELPVRTVIAAVFLATLISGCGGPKPIDAGTLASAQECYDKAVEDMAAEDYEAAAEALESALTPGAGLSPDLYTGARIERAKCYAHLKRFEEAHADLDIAAEGSVNLAVVHATRSFVFKQEGKDAEASKEMSAAKKIDRRVKAVR